MARLYALCVTLFLNFRKGSPTPRRSSNRHHLVEIGWSVVQCNQYKAKNRPLTVVNRKVNALLVNAKITTRLDELRELLVEAN